jgi:hypothetical protein
VKRLNIGQESEAFIAEPLPEPTEVPVEPVEEPVLVPVARVERERETVAT